MHGDEGTPSKDNGGCSGDWVDGEFEGFGWSDATHKETVDECSQLSIAACDDLPLAVALPTSLVQVTDQSR